MDFARIPITLSVKIPLTLIPWRSLVTRDNVRADLLPVTWQLAVAFGQGAGTCLITGEAAAAVMDHYAEPLTRNLPSTATMLQLVEFMRALGASAAMQALRRGSAVIELVDIRHAIGKLVPKQAAPLGDCPVCLEQ